MPSDNKIVSRFLERYARALSTGDLDGIVACWGIPAFVMSDRGVQPVAEAKEVGAFFRQGIASYNARGIASTRPEIQRIERFGKNVFSVDVRWVNLDGNETETGVEEIRYALTAPNDEPPRIHVVILKEPINRSSRD